MKSYPACFVSSFDYWFLHPKSNSTFVLAHNLELTWPCQTSELLKRLASSSNRFEQVSIAHCWKDERIKSSKYSQWQHTNKVFLFLYFVKSKSMSPNSTMFLETHGMDMRMVDHIFFGYFLLSSWIPKYPESLMKTRTWHMHNRPPLSSM